MTTVSLFRSEAVYRFIEAQSIVYSTMNKRNTEL